MHDALIDLGLVWLGAVLILVSAVVTTTWFIRFACIDYWLPVCHNSTDWQAQQQQQQQQPLGRRKS